MLRHHGGEDSSGVHTVSGRFRRILSGSTPIPASIFNTEVKVAERNDITFRLHQRQGEVLLSEANEILYGGAAGGGKSHLMRILAIMCCLYVPGLLVYLFRRYSGDLIQNHFNGPTGFPELLAPFINDGYCKISYSPHACITFWNGAKIMACHCQYEKDVERFRGAEIHLLLIDELTLFTEHIYRYLRGRCRASDKLVIPKQLTDAYPGIRFPKIVCGTNPTGPGHNWVKASFIDPQKPWDIWQAPKAEGGFLRQFIPARLKDNPSLNYDEYMAALQGLGPSWLVQAMAEGNWNVKAGGALDDIWNNDTHTMPKFKIPATWYVDRTFDWGTTKPWACLYFAESDGSDVTMPDGTVIPTLPGDLFVIDELYGCSGKPDTGTGEIPQEVAAKIKQRDKELKLDVHDGAADSAIFGDTIGRGNTIARSFANCGIYWRHADKSPGSRKNGLVMVRERLKNALARDHEPGLFVFDHCRNFLRTVPSLQYAQNGDDDVDTTQEDHIYDCLRYRICQRISVALSADVFA